MTIYVPALNKIRNNQASSRRPILNPHVSVLDACGDNSQLSFCEFGESIIKQPTEVVSQQPDEFNLNGLDNSADVELNVKSGQTVSNEIMTKISNFVDQLRLEQEQQPQQVQTSEEARGITTQHNTTVRSTVNAPGYEDAQKKME